MKKTFFLLLFCVFSQFAIGQTTHLSFKNKNGLTFFIDIKHPVYSQRDLSRACGEIILFVNLKDELTFEELGDVLKKGSEPDEGVCTTFERCYESMFKNGIKAVNRWLKNNNY